MFLFTPVTDVIKLELFGNEGLIQKYCGTVNNYIVNGHGLVSNKSVTLTH